MRRFLAPFFVAWVLIAPAGLLFALGSRTDCPTCVFPGEEWEIVPRDGLSGFGWDADALGLVRDFVRDSANSTGIVVADRGRIVFQYGDIEELSYLASVRKSILAMLYGYWVENGTIDLNATMADLGVDDIGGLLPIELGATVDHLVTARSGVYHPASNGGDNLSEAPPRGSQQPGTYMLYSNWDFNAAGAVFEQLTGRDLYDEAQAQLAIPLRFQDWDRSMHRKSGNLSDLAQSGVPFLAFNPRHGAHRAPDAQRGLVGRGADHLAGVGAAHRERRDAARGDESGAAPGRLLRLRLHVVGVGWSARNRAVRGCVHRAGRGRAVDHGVPRPRPGGGAQDQLGVRPHHQLGVVGAGARAALRGEGNRDGGVAVERMRMRVNHRAEVTCGGRMGAGPRAVGRPWRRRAGAMVGSGGRAVRAGRSRARRGAACMLGALAVGCAPAGPPDAASGQAAAEPAPRKEIIQPEGVARLPVFSSAVRSGDLIFLSGAIGALPGVSPPTLAEGGIIPETRQTMDNLAAVLEAAGAGWQDVVKCTVFLADMADYATFNEVYLEYFPEDPPARSALAAAGLAFDARVEVECIAAAPEGSR